MISIRFIAKRAQPAPGRWTPDRLVIPRFAVDVDELRTWTMAIREVLVSNSIRGMLADDNAAFERAVAASTRTLTDV